jgi:hypothetical protein
MVFTPSKIVCSVLKYTLMPFTLLEVILYFYYYWCFLKDLEPYGCFILQMDSSVCDCDACDGCISVS